jgi:serine/threonine-protein kinase
MATVFLADDLRHDRPVALKVLHPELASALGPERFLREIKTAARLQHPHILTVYDSGEAAGQLWFTMPFVEGENLRDRLTREKQLPVTDAVRIARDAAMALDYAHRHGVVHRDVKPENVLLSDGQALVADFGIARSLTPDAGGEQDRLTATGLSVGTAAYMSPEQAAAERDVDARSDQYSLACVLYEMLAGEPPFAAPTAQASIARRFTEVPRPIRELRDAVPEGVDRALQTALARTPADRFPTTADFARALESPAASSAPTVVQAATRAGAPAEPARVARHVLGRRPLFTMLALGFLLGAGVLFAWRARDRGATAGGTTVAVLPFENLGDSTQAYFADGVTDAVRGKLSAIPTVTVIARASSAQYASSRKTPQQIGAELGVEYLLTGTVMWARGPGGAASRVQVSPELVRVRDGATRWQQPFDAELSDVFRVQGEIATKVADALGVALGGSERKLAERPTQNLAAYDAFLRGEEVWNSGAGDPVTLSAAIAAYERAVALDTGFALAWAQLSRARSLAYGNTLITRANAEGARIAAARALALAPGGYEGHLALGDYYSSVSPPDNPRALEEYATAARMAPGNADVLYSAAVTQQSLGRWDAALDPLRRSLALDPRSVRKARSLARALLWMRRYPEAREAADHALGIAPGDVSTFEIKTMIPLAQGDVTGARAVLRAAPREIDPTALATYFAQFWDLAWALEDDQRRLLVRLTPDAYGGDRVQWAIVFAQTYALLGDAVRTRAYADTAQAAFASALRETPADAQLHVLRGVALAYAGRRDEAVSEGERAVAMLPMSKDAYSGAYLQHQLARIYLLVGEPDRALDRLEPLLRVPYFLSPGWLRVDPTFDPLRSNPRFQRLAAGA